MAKRATDRDSQASCEIKLKSSSSRRSTVLRLSQLPRDYLAKVKRLDISTYSHFRELIHLATLDLKPTSEMRATSRVKPTN